MGRYYNGDISGKFWFALQSSDAADRFGASGEQPDILKYYFDENNLEDVKAEIKNIEDTLGDQLKVIEAFFEKNNGYSDKTLKEANISTEELKEYADLKLGIKIRDRIENFGECSFEAEL